MCVTPYSSMWGMCVHAAFPYGPPRTMCVLCAVCLSNVVDMTLIESLSGRGNGEPYHIKGPGYSFSHGKSLPSSVMGLTMSDAASFAWFLSNSMGGFHFWIGIHNGLS